MMATGKPAAGVSTLAALALNVEQKDKIIGSMMDAGRGQVYLAYYRYDPNSVLQQLEAPQALNPQSLSDDDKDQVIYVGDGAMKYAGLIPSLVSGKNQLASAEQQFISAAAVGFLGIEKYSRNDLLDLARCVPVYLRSVDALPKKPIMPL